MRQGKLISWPFSNTGLNHAEKPFIFIISNGM